MKTTKKCGGLHDNQTGSDSAGMRALYVNQQSILRLLLAFHVTAQFPLSPFVSQEGQSKQQEIDTVHIS